MSADFMADTEGLSVSALEDLLYFWEEMGAVSAFKISEIRHTLRRRYETEDINYYMTEFGMVRSHNGYDRRTTAR